MKCFAEDAGIESAVDIFKKGNLEATKRIPETLHIVFGILFFYMSSFIMDIMISKNKIRNFRGHPVTDVQISPSLRCFPN